MDVCCTLKPAMELAALSFVGAHTRKLQRMEESDAKLQKTQVVHDDAEHLRY